MTAALAPALVKPKHPEVRSKLPARGGARSIVDVVSLDMGASGVSADERMEFVRASRSLNYFELVELARQWVTVIP